MVVIGSCLAVISTTGYKTMAKKRKNPEPEAKSKKRHNKHENNSDDICQSACVSCKRPLRGQSKSAVDRNYDDDDDDDDTDNVGSDEKNQSSLDYGAPEHDSQDDDCSIEKNQAEVTRAPWVSFKTPLCGKSKSAIERNYDYDDDDADNEGPDRKNQSSLDIGFAEHDLGDDQDSSIEQNQAEVTRALHMASSATRVSSGTSVPILEQAHENGYQNIELHKLLMHNHRGHGCSLCKFKSRKLGKRRSHIVLADEKANTAQRRKVDFRGSTQMSYIPGRNTTLYREEIETIPSWDALRGGGLSTKAPHVEKKNNSNWNRAETVHNMCYDCLRDLQCGICQDILIDSCCLNCSHSFCAHCITRWREGDGRNSCPICSVQISTIVRTRMLDGVIEKMISYTSNDDLKQHRMEMIFDRQSQSRAHTTVRSQTDNHALRGGSTVVSEKEGFSSGTNIADWTVDGSTGRGTRNFIRNRSQKDHQAAGYDISPQNRNRMTIHRNCLHDNQPVQHSSSSSCHSPTQCESITNICNAGHRVRSRNQIPPGTHSELGPLGASSSFRNHDSHENYMP